MTPPAIPTESALPPDGSFKNTDRAPLSYLPSLQLKSRWKGELVDTDPGNTKSPPNVAGTHATGPAAPKRSWLAGDGIPSWLVSTILHTLLLASLLLVRFRDSAPSLGWMTVRLSDTRSDVIAFEQLPVEATDMVVIADSDLSNPPQSPSTLYSTTVPVPSPLANDASESPEASALFHAAPSGEMVSRQLPSGGLHARDPASRAALGLRYGATPQSEDAVEAALKWLAAHQRQDGSWSFDLSLAPCNGQCRHSKKIDRSPTPATAATGLALLAFLGAGYTHHDGKYADQVRRGLYFLREEARPAGSALDLQSGSMYGHGIAMMAVGEAMAMTRYQGKMDSDLFALTNGGSSFTMTAQHSLGGWRYVPGSPGDMTVTAWQVLSLLSAQHGGVVLRTTTLSQAEQFVRSLTANDEYAFGYQSSEKPEPTPTAIGLCLLLYLGQSPQHTRFAHALNELVKGKPKQNDVYHNYYATLALHLARHPNWAEWHVPLRDHLVRTQATQGHETGSWHFPDQHGDVGGRLYTTAMAAMILEVYYRYLPLYQSQDEFRLD